jgi:hypothetical protein
MEQQMPKLSGEYLKLVKVFNPLEPGGADLSTYQKRFKTLQEAIPTILREEVCFLFFFFSFSITRFDSF